MITSRSLRRASLQPAPSTKQGRQSSNITSFSNNRVDVVTLLTTFGSLADVTSASVDELRLCPGMGDNKAQRLHALFNEPFYPPGRSKAAHVTTTTDTDLDAADNVDIDIAALQSDEEIETGEDHEAEL